MKHKPLRIAITGNIGSGKSFVCQIFKSHGIPVFDSDSEAKKIYFVPRVKEIITNRFGPEVYLSDTILNRRYLASILFSDSEALSFVESTIYPELNAYFSQWADSQQDVPFVLYESALIYEKHLEAVFDAIIVVSASEATRIRRVIFRDGCTEEAVRQRMAQQLLQEEKVSRADYVISHDSDDDGDSLKQQVEKVIESIRS